MLRLQRLAKNQKGEEREDAWDRDSREKCGHRNNVRRLA